MLPRFFKSYDIRGKASSELDGCFATALGQAAVLELGAKKIVTGRDSRLSGPELEEKLIDGLLAQGAEVTSLGICGTEEIYYAAGGEDFDCGIMVTGSHNPADENGFKIVRGGAIPVGLDSGLAAIGARTMNILQNCRHISTSQSHAPKKHSAEWRQKYISWLIEYSGLDKLEMTTLRVLIDAGNGAAGSLLASLAPRLPFEIIGVNMEPDGTFPNGVPNPLLPERREATAKAVRAKGAHVGVAFDGDFDRCFFYDRNGAFIEGYYLVGFLAAQLLKGHPGAKIVHDPRVYWNTRELVSRNGGIAVMGKSGHVFMKQTMRTENALYGGEMSAHHYFRDFAFCDSGMLAMLLTLACIAGNGGDLGGMLAERMALFPCSGEINFRDVRTDEAIKNILERYTPNATHIDRLDGINLEFPQWRFSLRPSNTEPLLRLNVESRGNMELLEEKTAEIALLLKTFQN